MISTWTTVGENGHEQIKKMAEGLKSKGYKIIEIKEDLIQQGTNAKGDPIMMPGWRITFNDYRPGPARNVDESGTRWLWDND